MTIGQISKAVGISASAIRFYESTGLLPQPRRKNGVREYDESAIEEIKVLLYFRHNGVSIRSLSAENRHAAVERRIRELESVIDEAQAMKTRLESLLACRCNGETAQCVIFA